MELTGSEKQISWATEIQSKAESVVSQVVEDLRNKKYGWIAVEIQALVADKLEKFYQDTVTAQSASLWIDRKHLGNADLKTSTFLTVLADEVVADLGGADKFEEFAREYRTREREARRAARRAEGK